MKAKNLLFYNVPLVNQKLYCQTCGRVLKAYYKRRHYGYYHKTGKAIIRFECVSQCIIPWHRWGYGTQQRCIWNGEEWVCYWNTNPNAGCLE